MGSVVVYNGAGTYGWKKPYGAKIIKIQLWGAGGGGQGGRGTAGTYSAPAGVGGQGGCCIIRYIAASLLPAAVTVVIGRGGSAGSAGGGPFSSPPGTNGGDSYFHTYVAYGGVANADAAQKGTAGANLPSFFGDHALGGAVGYQPTAGWCTMYAGAQWGNASSIFGGAAGGTGGGTYAGGTDAAGSAGGIKGYYYTGGGAAGGPGGPLNLNGESGEGTWKGGGGGGSDVNGSGHTGGAGGFAAGGGGGGGGYTGGGGGVGGSGYAIICAY